MRSNPSLFAHTLESWQTRPSIQDRLTIYSEHPRKVICTIIHNSRMDEADLKLIKAAPQTAAALDLTRKALLALAQSSTDPDVHKQIAEAVNEATHALIAAGAIPTETPGDLLA